MQVNAQPTGASSREEYNTDERHSGHGQQRSRRTAAQCATIARNWINQRDTTSSTTATPSNSDMEDIARDYLRLREEIAEYAQGHERYALDPDNEDDPERIEDSRILADNLRTILVPADQRDQLTDIVALLPGQLVEQVKEWKTSSFKNATIEGLDEKTIAVNQRKQALDDYAVNILDQIAKHIIPMTR